MVAKRLSFKPVKQITDISAQPDHPPSPLRIYAGVLADALVLISASHGLSRAELIAHGLPDTTAKELHELATIYFGDTAYTRMRAATIQSIRANRHGLPTLLEIERQASRVKGQLDKWKIRQHAAGLSGSAREIGTAARIFTNELKGPPAPPEEGCKLTRSQKSDVWSFKINAPSKEVAEIEQHIKKPSDLIDLIRARDNAAATAATADGVTADASAAATTAGSEDAAHHSEDSAATTANKVAMQHVTCTNCGCATEAKQVISGLRTNIIITLDELTEVLRDDGDDIILKMTNGATMKGKDFVTALLADAGLVTLVHPYHGPANLYRLSRLANEKQRLMAMAEMPTCAWPGCNHPADKAQVHHLKAWRFGGVTNPENLTIACPYHNGVNDDDPSKPRRGRLERVNGKVRRIPPWATTYQAARATV